MTNEEKQKLNEKLARWAGFKQKHIDREEYLGYFWYSPEKQHTRESPPDFTNSLDACFKWLVPKIREKGLAINIYSAGAFKAYEVAVFVNRGQTPKGEIANTPALALCLAIEKLIDAERQISCKVTGGLAVTE